MVYDSCISIGEHFVNDCLSNHQKNKFVTLNASSDKWSYTTGDIDAYYIDFLLLST